MEDKIIEIYGLSLSFAIIFLHENLILTFPADVLIVCESHCFQATRGAAVATREESWWCKACFPTLTSRQGSLTYMSLKFGLVLP